MPDTTAEVVIIGAGLVGLSVAYHLTQRGCRDVLLIEQQQQAAQGSTARSLAGVRHQFSSAVNVQLSRYSIARIRHFAEEVGEDAGYDPVGYMFLVDNATTWQQFQQYVALQHAHGARVELLSPDEAARCVPQTCTDDLIGATFGPDDGFCNPLRMAAGYLRRAREQGARLWYNCAMHHSARDSSGVQRLHTSQGSISCGAVVNAAGAWAGQVAEQAGLSVPVQPFRRCIYVSTPFPTMPSPLPLTVDIGSNMFLRKADNETLYLGRSNPHEPSSFRTTVDWEWYTTVHTAGVRRFPVLHAVQLDRARCWAGLYAITPDANPVLGRNPACPNWYDACGFSGHGVMHAPATGLLLAEELLDGRAHSINIDPLRLARFAQGHPPAERNAI